MSNNHRTAGTLAPRTNQTQERVSDVVANTTTQDQTYMNHPFKLQNEKRPTPETKAPSSSEPSSESLKPQLPYTASPNRSHRETGESKEQLEHTLIKRTPSRLRNGQVSRNLKLLKNNRLVLLTTYNHAAITLPLTPLLKQDRGQTLKPTKKCLIFNLYVK
ncbi:hypothetical protein YC2023_051281 [Brassica napus]